MGGEAVGATSAAAAKPGGEEWRLRRRPRPSARRRSERVEDGPATIGSVGGVANDRGRGRTSGGDEGCGVQPIGARRYLAATAQRACPKRGALVKTRKAETLLRPAPSARLESSAASPATRSASRLWPRLSACEQTSTKKM